MVILPTFKFLNATVRILYNAATGTGTLLSISNRLFLITCDHIVSGIHSNDNIGIRRDNSWSLAQVQDIIKPADGGDIIALRLGRGNDNLPDESNVSYKLVIGEQVIFCGFPLNLEIDGGDMNNGFPIPLIKSGIFSGHGDVNGKRMLLFDAHNNSGFSGGPIITGMAGVKSLKIIGIVQGYKYDKLTPVMRQYEPGKFRETEDYFVQTNSGFMYGTPIFNILKEIKREFPR